MPYSDGTPTKRDLIRAWWASGKVGPHPCPPAKTDADRQVRREIDALNRQLKRGKYAPRPLSDSETAARAEAKRLRRLAVIQSGKQRTRTGPSQLEIAESWKARGCPADEPVPRLVQQRRAAQARSNAKQAKLRECARLERLLRMPQVQGGGRPDLPLDREAGQRLLQWFTIWDTCTIPDDWQDETIRYGVPSRVDWAR